MRGKVFRVDAAGNFATVFSFGPYSYDGWAPTTNPIEGRDGFLYGTTPRGGSSPSGSYGVVYRLSRSGSLTVLHSFSGPDGIQPWAPLLQASDGVFYGSTIVGGAAGLGTLFKLDVAQPAPLPKLVLLTVNPMSVVGGRSVLGTVTLSSAALPGDATVSLSTDSSLAAVPASVTVPAGLTTASFVVTTNATRKARVATIAAAYAGSRVTATLTITR